MMIHLFGASTLSGEALRILAECHVTTYSRNVEHINDFIRRVDLSDSGSFHPVLTSDSSDILISFAPIWLFASFLEHLQCDRPELLQCFAGVIACSSSSAITKRFAANSHDRKLAATLTEAEDQVFKCCRKLSLPCQVLRPTLIYGCVGNFRDSNLSLVLKQLRRLPMLPFPAESGLRQPIHACQLAAVTLHLADQIVSDGLNLLAPKPIALGGDTTLTYLEMIMALQNALPLSDPGRRCRLLLIPNRFFFLLAIPLLLFSPKTFEAILRMASDLSGFIPASHLNGSEVQPFPMQPLV